MKNKLKVAILGAYPLIESDKSLGGAHIHIFDLIERLSEYGDLDLNVITFSSLIKKDKKVRRGNITVHYLHSPKVPRLIAGLTIEQFKTIKKIKELDPDIIHAQSTAPLFGFPVSLLVKKYPTILTVHGIVQEEAKSWQGPIGFIKGVIYGSMEKFALRRIPSIIAVTPYVKEKIRKFSKGSIHVIPVGINESFFDLPNNEQRNRLLFVGGVEPRKGLIHLLRAVKILKNINPDIEVHIIGRVRKQKYYAELKEYVKINNLGKTVQFLGFLSDEEIKKEYSECSIFVLPSQEESQGLVLVEAMAAGKPVVASNIGGIPHVVDDNETGFLVGYGDSERFAERITLLLENEKLRERMGKNGKERAKEFLYDEIVRRHYDLYKELLGNKGKNG